MKEIRRIMVFGAHPDDPDAKKGTRVAAAEKDGKKARKLKASGKII